MVEMVTHPPWGQWDGAQMTAPGPQSPAKGETLLPGQVHLPGWDPQLRHSLDRVLPTTPLPAPGHLARHICRSWCPRKDLVHRGTQALPRSWKPRWPLATRVLEPPHMQVEERFYLVAGVTDPHTRPWALSPHAPLWGKGYGEPVPALGFSQMYDSVDTSHP